jgi:hypothetical protein
MAILFDPHCFEFAKLTFFDRTEFLAPEGSLASSLPPRPLVSLCYPQITNESFATIHDSGQQLPIKWWGFSCSAFFFDRSTD